MDTSILKEETKQMGLMKKLTSAIVASSLVFTLVGSASAAYSADSANQSATRMQALKIVQGMPDGTLGLDKEITRAELVTIIVRAFGQEDNAKLLMGSTGGFTDTAKHWASGNIAMATALVSKVGGDAIGLPDGTFNPDGKLTPAQAVAFLMKFLGVKADPAKAWPANYLDKAVDMGLIAADDKATIANQANTNATRGLAFYLFDRAFANYTLSNGKTFYTTYVDTMAPELTIKNDAVSTTMDSKVTVTGTVTGASELYVGTTKVTPDASGNFSSDVTLGDVKADPYTITVTARDLAGNKTEKSIKVTRTVGTAASIEASDITVAAGGTATVSAVVKDAKGNVLANQMVTGTSTVGTFDNGTFTAAKTAGTGTLTLKVGDVSKDVKVTINAGDIAKVVADKASVAPGAIVTLIAKDANDNVIAGATFSQTSADAMLDASTGKFMASKAGTYTVTATANGKTATATIGVYASAAKLQITVPSTGFVANDASYYDVQVAVVDANGNIVSNYNQPITLGGDLTVDTNGLRPVNGVATFSVMAPSSQPAGESDITATSDPSSTVVGDDITGTATATVIAQVATKLKVSAPAYLAVNDGSASGYVRVLDQTGNYMKSGSWDVTLNVTGPAYLSATGGKTTLNVAATGSSSNNFTLYAVDATQIGAITTTASFTGLTSATGNTTAAYGLAAANITVANVSTGAVKAGETDGFVFKIQLVDKNGVTRNAAAGGQSVTLTFNNSDYDQLLVKGGTTSSAVDTYAELAGGSVPDSNKQVTVTIPAGSSTYYVGVGAQNLTGDVPVTAQSTVAGSTVSANTTVSFLAGDADYVALTRTSAINVLTSNPTVTLTAQVYDMSGNVVKKPGVKVKFTENNSAYTYVKLAGAAQAYETTTAADGTATVAVNVLPYTGVTPVIKAQYDLDGSGYTGASTVSLNMAAAIDNAITVTTWNGTTRTSGFAVGATMEVRVQITDNNNLNVTGAAAAANLAFDGINWGTDVTEASPGPSFTFNNNGTPLDTTDDYYYVDLTPKKAETLSFTVKDTSTAASIKVTKNVAFSAGAANKLIVAEKNSSGLLDMATGAVKAFTVQVADVNGNLVSPNMVTSAVTFTAALTDKTGSAGAGTYYDVRSAADGGSKATWTINPGNNSITIYVVTNDPDSATLTLTPTAGIAGAATAIDVTVAQ